MLWAALQDPDPVLIFEYSTLYNMKGELPSEIKPVDLDSAKVMRTGNDVTLISYGASLFKTLDAAGELADAGIDAEVIDLRTLRPLDDATYIASIQKTNRAVIVDEGWKSGGISAEIATRIMEQAFYDLDAPVERVCSEEVPTPYAKHLETAMMPQVDKIVAAARKVVRHA